jgi:HEAT repeats
MGSQTPGSGRRGASLLKTLGVLVLVGAVLGAGVREAQALPPAWAGRVARWKPPGSDLDSLIADLLKGKSRDARVRAAQALGRSSDSRALDALLATLKDSDRSVRQAVADALGEFRNPKAIEPLLQAAMEDRDRDVRESAGEALSRFTNRALAGAPGGGAPGRSAGGTAERTASSRDPALDARDLSGGGRLPDRRRGRAGGREVREGRLAAPEPLAQRRTRRPVQGARGDCDRQDP